MSPRTTQVWDIIPSLTGVPSPERDKRTIMALQVYVDDSGTGGDSPVFILAGCEAEASQWAAFTDEWREALNAEPAIEYFKASECFSQRGQFEGWDKVACSQKAEMLSSIIPKYVDRAFIFEVNAVEYADVFRGKIDFRYDKPYFLMAHDLCEQLLSIQINERGRAPIEIIFDNNDGVSILINQIYAEARKNSIGTESAFIFEEVMPILPIFQDEKKALPLQAADMVAWFFRRIFGKIVISCESGAAWDNFKTVPIDHFSTGKDFLEKRREEILNILPEGKVYFHQLVQSRQSFDQRISEHNIEILRAGSHYPTLVSVSSKQMRQRRLVQSCMAHDTPHLHTQDGKQCFGGTSQD